MSRVCRRQKYAYITPRQQFPPKPERPVLYIAEGAESIKHTRLLCPGQVIRVESKKYLVMTIYWVGSRTQGKERFSPRSSMQVLLLSLPLKEKLTNKIYASIDYCRAEVASLMDTRSPNPVVYQPICQKTVRDVTLHVCSIVR